VRRPARARPAREHLCATIAAPAGRRTQRYSGELDLAVATGDRIRVDADNGNVTIIERR
jgi:hypothetical protein